MTLPMIESWSPELLANWMVILGIMSVKYLNEE